MAIVSRLSFILVFIMAIFSIFVGTYTYVSCGECQVLVYHHSLDEVRNLAEWRLSKGAVERRAAGGSPAVKTAEVVLVFPLRNRTLHYVWQMEHLRTIVRPAWNFSTIVVEQGDREPFRRGWLLNIGILEASRRFGEGACVVTHDVDYAAAPSVDYAWCDEPTQPCSEISCFDGGVPYDWYCGGVMNMRLRDWRRLNGYTNHASGWGAEDDELYYRARQSGVLSSRLPRRAPKGEGRCYCMDGGGHTAREKHMPSYNSTMRQMEAIRGGSTVWKYDGLNSIRYSIARRSVDGYGTDWITVLPDIGLPEINYSYLLS